MTLMPFGDAALDHFMFIERPEDLDIADGAGFSHANHYRRIARPDMLAPAPQDYASQGHLYRGALHGLARLAEQLGEDRVFVGHGQAQVGPEEFGLPGLFRIDDLVSAQRAIEEIVTQGEGAPAHSDDSRFARSARSGRNSTSCARRDPTSSPRARSSTTRCSATSASRTTARASSTRSRPRWSISPTRSMP